MAEAATTGSEMGSEEEVGVSHSGGDGRHRWLHIWGLSCVGGFVVLVLELIAVPATWLVGFLRWWSASCLRARSVGKICLQVVAIQLR